MKRALHFNRYVLIALVGAISSAQSAETRMEPELLASVAAFFAVESNVQDKGSVELALAMLDPNSEFHQRVMAPVAQELPVGFESKIDRYNDQWRKMVRGEIPIPGRLEQDPVRREWEDVRESVYRAIRNSMDAIIRGILLRADEIQAQLENETATPAMMDRASRELIPFRHFRTQNPGVADYVETVLSKIEATRSGKQMDIAQAFARIGLRKGYVGGSPILINERALQADGLRLKIKGMRSELACLLLDEAESLEAPTGPSQSSKFAEDHAKIRRRLWGEVFPN